MFPDHSVAAPTQTIAHLSDLHIGYSPERFRIAQELLKIIQTRGVDHVVITGDLTEHGRDSEFALLNELFASFLAEGRLTIVPGNHDRLSEDAARNMMRPQRVDVVTREGLRMIRIDTTGTHNRLHFLEHGTLSERTLNEVSVALDTAQTGELVVALLHHHLLPLPGDNRLERISDWIGLPFAEELRLGRALLERLRGKCDLVLHGHRHAPVDVLFGHETRNLRLYNAGSSTELGKFRIFTHQEGKLLGEPVWALPIQTPLMT